MKKLRSLSSCRQQGLASFNMTATKDDDGGKSGNSMAVAIVLPSLFAIILVLLLAVSVPQHSSSRLHTESLTDGGCTVPFFFRGLPNPKLRVKKLKDGTNAWPDWTRVQSHSPLSTGRRNNVRKTQRPQSRLIRYGKDVSFPGVNLHFRVRMLISR